MITINVNINIIIIISFYICFTFPFFILVFFFHFNENVCCKHENTVYNSSKTRYKYLAIKNVYTKDKRTDKADYN